MQGMRLFVDMDGTLARFHDQVRYMERMFEKDFFLNLDPFENLVSGIRLFKEEHPDIEVFILSACVKGEGLFCEADKNKWLNIYLPEIDMAHRIYTDVGKPKAEYIPGGISKADYLLDDYNRSLNSWLYAGGSAIKCHNNINQKGLGAHGGSAGFLWTGKMVHTEDDPTIVSAELAQHMGLEYDLDKVIRAHIAEGTDMDLARKELADVGFQNPLNALRYLIVGNDFQEQAIQGKNGEVYHVTNAELRAICKNAFDIENHSILLENALDEVVQAIQDDRNASDQAIVGQIQYLNSQGIVGERRIFRSYEEMKAEIDECWDHGCPLTKEWFVEPDLTKIHASEKMSLETIISTASRKQETPLQPTDSYTPEY